MADHESDPEDPDVGEVRPRGAQKVWNEEVSKRLQRLLFVGWNSTQIAGHFQVDINTVSRWKKKLKRDQRVALEGKPKAFLAETESFFGELEAIAMQGIHTKDISAAAKAGFIKQARECRQARVTMRTATGYMPAQVPGATDPKDMKDGEVDKETKALAARLHILNPTKAKAAAKANATPTQWKRKPKGRVPPKRAVEPPAPDPEEGPGEPEDQAVGEE